MKKCIIYIGDFDLRNQNVQAHLVLNNGKIFNSFGYSVFYIGVNRYITSFKNLQPLPQSDTFKDHYLELPNSLNTPGIFICKDICKLIINNLNLQKKEFKIDGVITYQSPSYAVAVKKIAKWCKKNNVPYIVNCADLPIFDLQSPIRKIVMKLNWNYLHSINKKYADGIIAISHFIADYFRKPGRPTIILPPLFDCGQTPSDFTPNETSSFIYAGTPFLITGHKVDPKGMKDRLDKVIDIFIALSEKGVKYIFNIIGITKEDYLIGVPKHKKALENINNIFFYGKLSHKETLFMISTSDFSINYRDENLMTKAGFSTKIVESVSLGTPVVINDISDTFDYLEEGISGFKLTGDIDKDSVTVKKLCEISLNDRRQLKIKIANSKIFDFSKYEYKIKEFMSSFKNTLT